MEQVYKLYSSLPDLERRKTWAEIDLGALRANYRILKETATAKDPSVRTIAVVKAEAYGHGAPACVAALLTEGCDYFAVSCMDEAVAVRTVCDENHKEADILILGYTPPELALLLGRYGITQTLLSEDYAVRLEQEAAAAGVTIRTHIALDTGMNRIGFPAHSEDEIGATVGAILRVIGFRHLSVEGMFTHFARADECPNGDGEALTTLQAARYRTVRTTLETHGVSIPFHHVCNSAATVRRATDRMNGVRLGILLYGARPSDQIELPLKPVMKLRTVISHLHKLLPGESVSYGGTFSADTERLIATIPIGYADGFLRAYSGSFVTVETKTGPKPVPIVGRICMDQCMIDVTDTGASVGDIVTLFGNDPKELYACADRAATIDYECLCLISSRVIRIYKQAPDTDTNTAELQSIAAKEMR